MSDPGTLLRQLIEFWQRRSGELAEKIKQLREGE